MVRSLTLRDMTLLVFGAVGVIWYYVCLIVIGAKLLDGAPQATNFREFMSVSITTIGVSLATFVGMLLGLRAVAEEVRAGVGRLQSSKGIDAGASAEVVRLNEFSNSAAGSTLQWLAALLYIASLLIAIYFWYRHGNSTDPAITNLAKSLLGLIGGALSIVLNLPR
jgi:hypothetical protein